RKRQRLDRMRRDARKRAPLADRFPRAPEVERLQIPQAAVDRTEMIERRAAAEVVALDQRDRQPAVRRVVRDRQAVHTAADDEHVERAAGQPIDVANHEGQILSLYCRSTWQPRRTSGPIGTITFTTSTSRGIRSAPAAFSTTSISTISKSSTTCRGSS